MRLKDVKKRAIFGMMIVLVSVLLAGCGGNDTQATGPGKKVVFETIKQGHLGFSFKNQEREEFLVFRSAHEWDKFWSQSTTTAVTGQDAVDPINPGQPFVDPDPISDQLSSISESADFTEQDMIIGTFFYEGAGYDVNISNIRKFKDRIQVEVTGETFDDDQPGMIAPYHIVKLPISDLPVKFRFIDKR